MAAITAAMVKDLRDQTGAGMMDCKKALAANDGDMEKAKDYLREKGLAKAAKRAGRATGEGQIVVAENESAIVMASTLCETDFVSRGEAFQALAAKTAKCALDTNPADEAALEAAMKDEIANFVASCGENTKVGKFFRVEVPANTYVGRYVHFNGKLGVLVTMVCGKPESTKSEAIAELGKEVAMQVNAMNPMALDRTSLDPAVIERERNVYREKARNDGKPEKIIDKIAEGAVNKFLKEVCLMDQAYFRDDKKSISQYVNEVAKSLDDTITVTGYCRLALAAE